VFATNYYTHRGFIVVSNREMRGYGLSGNDVVKVRLSYMGFVIDTIAFYKKYRTTPQIKFNTYITRLLLKRCNCNSARIPVIVHEIKRLGDMPIVYSGRFLTTTIDSPEVFLKTRIRDLEPETIIAQEKSHKIFIDVKYRTKFTKASLSMVTNAVPVRSSTPPTTNLVIRLVKFKRYGSLPWQVNIRFSVIIGTPVFEASEIIPGATGYMAYVPPSALRHGTTHLAFCNYSTGECSIEYAEADVKKGFI
jgi:hypothetical protein